MTRVLVAGVVAALFVATIPVALCQTPPPPSPSPANPQLYRQQQTWYEVALKQLNSRDIYWGSWLEQRRQALLQSTAKNEYFWYSFSVTAALLLMICAYGKLWHDRHKALRLAVEQMAAIRNHDIHSREIAREAIRKHNEHIERCNRAVEAAESGQWQQSAGNPEVASLRVRLDEAAAKLETVTREKARLQAELTQKSALLTDLSLRLDALARKSPIPATSDRPQGAPPANGGSASQAELVRHINNLQQELYAEREKNKRLKGA